MLSQGCPAPSTVARAGGGGRLAILYVPKLASRLHIACPDVPVQGIAWTEGHAVRKRGGQFCIRAVEVEGSDERGSIGGLG